MDCGTEGLQEPPADHPNLRLAANMGITAQLFSRIH